MAGLQRQLQAVVRWKQTKGTVHEEVRLRIARLDECEEELRVYNARNESRRQRRRQTEANQQGTNDQRESLRCKSEEAYKNLKETLNGVTQLALDSCMPEILMEEGIGGGILDLADAFQDNSEVVEIVLQNTSLRRKLDAIPDVAYSPEVLSLWISRSLEDYANITELPGHTEHMVWKVQTPDGNDAVLKRYHSRTERKSFLREVRTVARLRKHPGVITVDAWFEIPDAGHLYLQVCNSVCVPSV